MSRQFYKKVQIVEQRRATPRIGAKIERRSGNLSPLRSKAEYRIRRVRCPINRSLGRSEGAKPNVGQACLAFPSSLSPTIAAFATQNTSTSRYFLLSISECRKSHSKIPVEHEHHFVEYGLGWICNFTATTASHQAMNMAIVLNGNKVSNWRTGVNLTGPVNSCCRRILHFDPVGDPAGESSHRKQNREHLNGDAHRAIDHTRIEIDVGVEFFVR